MTGVVVAQNANVTLTVGSDLGKRQGSGVLA
jgi:hypothetical protein